MRFKKRKSKYRPGDHLMQSDLTGRIAHRSEMRKMWNGLFCHKDEFEIRNPQDFLKGKKDQQSVETVRPRTTSTYTTVTPGDL